MAPLAVVENFDVFLNRRFDVSTRGIASMMNYLILEATLEALHRRVVIAVPLARHGSLYAELLHQLPVVVGTILGEFNRSSQHAVSLVCLKMRGRDGDRQPLVILGVCRR